MRDASEYRRRVIVAAGTVKNGYTGYTEVVYGHLLGKTTEAVGRVSTVAGEREVLFFTDGAFADGQPLGEWP